MLAENVAAVRRAVASFNDRSTREEYFTLYDPGCQVHGLPPGLPGTLEGLRTFYETVWQAFPDIVITMEDLFGQDESLAVRFEAIGLHTGAFFGMPPSGKRATFFVLCLLRFHGGRVVERWAQMSVIE